MFHYWINDTMTDTIQIIARIALAAILLGSVAVAVWKHGNTAPARQINAWHVVGAVGVEALLIGLAGGWGTW